MDSVFITGGSGYLGRLVTGEFAARRGEGQTIVSADLRLPAETDRLQGVTYVESDVRSPDLADLFEKYRIDVVVHLVAIVTPGKKPDRELEYSVDVLGTKNVLECCNKAGVKQLVYTSSGAAYGYHPDNPEWLVETDSLRGNPEFAYSDHKRQIEEMLATWRSEYPRLNQLILRPGTILGTTVKNQITALFEGKRVMTISGAATPFVLIWDKDVAEIILQGVEEGKTGIYNLAGDGAIPMREMARMMGKSTFSLPEWFLKGALSLLKALRLTPYGPEQTRFLLYRPVLSNEKLKTEFGFVPHLTTREVWEYYVENTRG